MTYVETGVRLPTTEVGSLRDPASRSKATAIVSRGDPVGLYNVAVCAILGDGRSQAFVDSVREIKGEGRGQRPLGACLTTAEFVELLDPTQIPPALHDTFLNATELAQRTSSLCFIRGPITKSAAESLPPSIVSWVEDIPVIQNWDAAGHQPTNLLLAEMRRAGVRYPAITSMNISGEPEIVEEAKAIKFSQDHNLGLFLTDDHVNTDVSGSYTILGVGNSGVSLIRDGNVPGALLENILKTEISREGSTVAKSVHPVSVPLDSFDGLDPRTARIVVLSSLRKTPLPHLERVVHHKAA